LGARDLETITEVQLAMLAAGTGVSIERLREMNTAAIMGRLTAKIADWMLTKEGRDSLADQDDDQAYDGPAGGSSHNR